jgi:hypothetical protein
MRENQGWPRFAIMVEYLYEQIIEYANEHTELKITTPERL